MLLNPAIMALVLVSAVVSLMLLLAAGFGLQVVRHWDINSGSERQLNLERRTYLISTLLTWAFASELVSLLLFIYNAESMSGQFVGAMCATGVLNVNEWGWPTLFLKMTIFFSGAAWLALNYLDNQGYDYPLVKLKYVLLLLIVPMVLAEFYVQLRHFLEMDPDVITSCCGALFSADAEGVAAEVSSLQPRSAMFALYGTGVAALGSGVWYGLKRSGGPLFAILSGAAFVMALVAIVSFVSLYIYEHPHHHCPFCILKSGHDYAGYFLYIPLFFATALAFGAGMIAPWKRVPSLTEAVERDAPRLTWMAIGLFGVFYLIATWAVVSSNLVMSEVWW
ncbi:MAG: hypothetical protein DIZ77_15435 [endosymbiont of Seepiophila jonesi]|uniref:Uncharacterized protein n=1 Tax=endosymbiont of Lamellibrachia luymesi TaxID=2200907 RepID=A0A370DZU0_9GAMM|nr:MAG: hypothetical protein DIZ77_15435 [endosymbiont of Seepiophila jonesi]RDH92367.1 MAG: hypothetical protein DIZ79_03630 [endosymbiont of Lamellibrachia luymesi]